MLSLLSLFRQKIRDNNIKNKELQGNTKEYRNYLDLV